ncbi:MAG: DNA polymerase Y family protein [Gemmatimonadota bacterium]|nr:DNA polymerase Y family protein [Gemmatimonadota bacterium]
MDRVGATPKSAAGRTACINIRALPLQLLLRKHPEWKRRPVAVVEKENPQSPILWVNPAAGRAGIRTGMRYAAALSLDQNLCAGTVSEREIQAAVRQVHGLLERFSPRIEPSNDEPGIFWVDAGGLDKLHTSLEDWARQIDARLSRLALKAGIVVGFGRFGSYAVARSASRVIVFPSPEVEQAESRTVRLLHLQIDPKLRDRLEKLAVHTVNDFLALPAGGIVHHLGEEAWNLYRFASGTLSLPIQSRKIPEPLRVRIDLDEPESNAQRLLFWIRQRLDPLLRATAARCQAVAALHLQLLLEDGERHRQRIQPARPTLEAPVLLDLLRLHLETVSFRAPPVELALEAEGVYVSTEALDLLQQNPRRNLEAALDALARVRAEFGPDSVLSARLKPGHLPEARFEWQPFGKLAVASPQPVLLRPLVRRVHACPEHLEGASLYHAKNRKPTPGAGHPPGHAISGGWWHREVRRDYRFIKNHRGERLWIYYDEQARRWYAQGRVE